MLVGLMLAWRSAPAFEPVPLDDFESLSGWTLYKSEGVDAEIALDDGVSGMGLRLDYDFHGALGFVILRKELPLDLPENYALGFQIRGEGPANNLEVKLVKPGQEGVWWQNRRNYAFPAEWTRYTVRRRQLERAWGGASGDPPPSRIQAIELAVSVGRGGKGSVWLDDLRLTERPPADTPPPPILALASTSVEGEGAERALDHDPATRWRSGSLTPTQWLMLDLQEVREFGGLVIDWDPQDFGVAYTVQLSMDKETWSRVHEVEAGNGGRDYLYLPDGEARYIRLDLRRGSRAQGYAVAEIGLRPLEFATDLNRFFSEVAREGPRGRYPRYLLGEQTYWTVAGADGAEENGLLSSDGTLEVEKGGFSIEPFLYLDGALVSWAEVRPVPSLEDGDLPIPTVTWSHGGAGLAVTAFGAGDPTDSTLFARYRLSNQASEPRRLTLFLAVRPFQVNPPWQSLFMDGGVSPIHSLETEGRTVRVNGTRTLVSLTPPDRAGAALFAQGPVTDFLAQGKVPGQPGVKDAFGFASGALAYDLELAPGESRELYLAVPYGDPARLLSLGEAASVALGPRELDAARRSWREKLDRVGLDLPPQAAHIARTVRSTLGYMLVNRSGPGIRPGSRVYARSWIRDGSLTASALVCQGHPEEARAFLRWYAGFQFPNGKVPCCVDQRGPDPTPEHDSNGQLIYGIMEYYRYTRDVGFLHEMWPHVVKAVDYVETLRAQRTTEVYRTPELRPYYGLMPESISHEGYSSQPVHAYWDDFFVLRGLKDAAEMARILGEPEGRFAALRDAFREDLYASILETMGRHGIHYIPASVELGDFDPTAISAAVAPGRELLNLPEEALRNLFEDYWSYFVQRRDGAIPWENYTPYELRNAVTFVRLGQRERALDLLDFFLEGRRPLAWNQWPEIVWRDPAAPRFLGDLPHTWVGSDFLRAVRTLFVYEREDDHSLVLAAGIPASWLEGGEGVGIRRQPTHYGPLSYRLYREAPGRLRLELGGDLSLPPGGIRVEPPLPRTLKAVTLNGRPLEDFDRYGVLVREFPADLVLEYGD